MSRVFCWVVGLSVLVNLVPSVCWAQEAQPEPASDDRARDLYESGVALYEDGFYSKAVIAWREAYKLSHRPVILYNIYSALERLGRLQEALAVLVHYKGYASVDERDSIERKIRGLEMRLDNVKPTAASQPETLSTTEPLQMTVLDAPARLRPAVVLQPALLVAGAAGLVSGMVFGMKATGLRKDLQQQCVAGSDGLLCPASLSQTVEQEKTAALAADISASVGVACLGAGVGWLLVGPQTVQVGWHARF